MNFWLIIFNYGQWKELIVKNCSKRTLKEWYIDENQNIPIGILYASLGSFLVLMYIPFLIVMMRPKFIKYSCYKLMALIGIIDVFSTFVDGVVAGVQSMTGAHFCTNPVLFWITSNIISFAWYAVTFACVILAIDRFFELCWEDAANFLFGHYRIYFWMILPIIYTTFVSSTFIYNTTKLTYYTDPFFGTQMGGNPVFLPPWYHFVHNISVTSLLGIIYVSMVIVLKIKSILYPNTSISKMQKIMTLQALCICVEMFIAALLYVMNELISMPQFMNPIAQVFKIAVHGDTPLVYLCLNASLRRAVFDLVTNFAKTFKEIIQRRTTDRVSHENTSLHNKVFVNYWVGHKS